ncbi:MAG: Fic family protein [Acidiferrobacter sp.]
MNEDELRAIIARGEDSQHQFKRDFTNVDALAAELIALANSMGGQLFIGVADDSQVSGLAAADVARLNQLLSNAASQNVRPPINPVSSNVQTEQGLVMVVSVSEGLNKPYMDTQGRIWVKSGADKRHVTAREEMQRLFQTAGLVYADEVPARPATVDDIDAVAFSQYFGQRYRKPVEATGQPLPQLLQNLNLARDGVPNLAGLLLFGKAPHILKPAFVIKAVAFPGTVLHDSRYLDSEDFDGRLPEQYRRGMAFIKRSLRHVQGDLGFNSPGMLEVPEEVFEELLVNALVHRDYFISAPIRLLIFTDRVEIISPGHLPNHLDAEQIRYGLSNLRNPALASHAFHMLPYHGLGSGIPRATTAWPDIELIDDRRGNQFKVIVRRPKPHAQVIAPAGIGLPPEVTPEVTPEVINMLSVINGEMSRGEIMTKLRLKDEKHFREHYQQAGITRGVIEMTLPDKPRSSKQRYRLTEQGRALLVERKNKELKP